MQGGLSPCKTCVFVHSGLPAMQVQEPCMGEGRATKPPSCCCFNVLGPHPNTFKFAPFVSKCVPRVYVHVHYVQGCMPLPNMYTLRTCVRTLEHARHICMGRARPRGLAAFQRTTRARTCPQEPSAIRPTMGPRWVQVAAARVGAFGCSPGGCIWLQPRGESYSSILLGSWSCKVVRELALVI